eukprot:TRINITY_DN14839_c0_g1_i1.p1 TRINITY_DN14839_c0_g1~~TRINITY_DN14839_c0_g1_i1.p1  ORF type:complete len:330 (+),score=55.72 TRINITY_DN14839_c0_g1_i1:157-1146(+)
MPSPVTSQDIPWVEKFRPKYVKEIVGNEESVSRLQVIAETGNMPNLLLAGPPGTGKTTSVLCVANNLLGDSVKDAVLELNASDDRGIDTVRTKIKEFAKRRVTLPAGRHKVVILDEADNMTPSAQQALRRTMEIYSSTTRFALACNDSSKIIEPIQSRCAILRYSKLSDEQILSRLLEVVRAEEVAYIDDGLEAIIFTADGDMRQALNNLQATYAGFGSITPENVFKVCDQPHPMVIREIVSFCMEGKFDDAVTHLSGLWHQGYSATDVISTLFRVVRAHDEMQEYLKLEYMKTIGLTHMRIAQGCASLLQLNGLLSRLCMISKAMAKR